MTKTLTPVVIHRFINFGLLAAILSGSTAEGSFVWNFEFGSLGFIWNLGFGVWNLSIFI
jgi:hypothetical protein